MIILANFIVVDEENRRNFGRCFDKFLQVFERIFLQTKASNRYVEE